MLTRPPGWQRSAELREHKEPQESIPECHQPHPNVGTTLCPGSCRGQAPWGSAGARGRVCVVGLLLFCLLFSRAEIKQAVV